MDVIATAQARREALEAAHPEWVPRTLAGALDHAVQRFGDRPLVIGDEITHTYHDVQAWSRGLAAGLLGAGIRPGDHVAVILANYPIFVALKYAIARVGATCVPINFLLRAGELAYILEQSDARVLITMDRFREMDYLAQLDAIAAGWRERAGGDRFGKLAHVFTFTTGEGPTDPAARTIDDLVALGAGRADELAALEPASAPDGPSDIIYTSGTTGSPKGVLLAHDMVLRTAYASAYWRAMADGWRIQFALPMYHVFGYVECLMAATFVGGAIIPHLQFDPDATLDAIERHRAHDLVCVPLMTWKVIDAQRARPRDLSSLVAVFSSGGMAPPEIWSAIRETLGAPELTTAYGMSETTASTTCTLPEGPDVMLSTTNGRLKDAGVAGDRALGGKLAIYKARDPQTGAELPPGAEGELMARGPIITKGYYNKPEETAATFTEDGWLCTGDVGTIDADGNLRLTGRIKETYRCAGETVMPREIEIVIETHPAVAEAHVVGVPHGRVGEVGCACIVPVDPLAPPTPEDVIALCTRELARFKVPRHVLIVRQEDLPRTATGRVQKFKLVEHVKPLLNPDQPTAVPVA